MSVAVGHVTRKDGKIVEFPDQVTKMLKWLTGVSLLTPVIMLLVGLGDPHGVPAWYWGMLICLLPALIIMSLISALRQNMRGNLAFGTTIVMLNYFAITIAPFSGDPLEMFITRAWPIIGIIAVLYFFRADLHYNLRPMWFSMKAMKEMQEMMMKQKMAREAKKRGETFDPNTTIDAEAIVRAMQAKTGKEIPAHMAGVTTKPGFRQESKNKQRSGGGGGNAQKKSPQKKSQANKGGGKGKGKKGKKR